MISHPFNASCTTVLCVCFYRIFLVSMPYFCHSYHISSISMHYVLVCCVVYVHLYNFFLVFMLCPSFKILSCVIMVSYLTDIHFKICYICISISYLIPYLYLCIMYVDYVFVCSIVCACVYIFFSLISMLSISSFSKICHIALSVGCYIIPTSSIMYEKSPRGGGE